MTAIVDRARAILLTPRTEWAVIAAEPQSVAGLYRGYLVWLAAIPALAGFIGLSLVGFGGQPDTVAAFKLIGYASTAALVAGIAYALPALSVIALLGALYSAWLIYVGAPVLMKCQQNRAVGYTARFCWCAD